MSTFTALQDRVRDIVLDVTSKAEARIGPEIVQAQQDLEDAHGFLAMEATFELTTVEDARTHANYAKPSDFLRTRMDAQPVRVSGTGSTTKIDWMISENDVVTLYSDDPLDKGAPQHIMERLSEFKVFPFPNALAPGGSLFSDGNWRVRIPYFKRLAVLVDATDTNWFSDNTEEYLVQQAAGRVLAFNRDHEESIRALSVAQAEQRRLIGQDKKQRIAKRRLLRPQLGARGSSFQSKMRGVR